MWTYEIKTYDIPSLITRRNGEWKKQEDGTFVKRINVVGHTKEMLNISVDSEEMLKICSNKDAKIPEYVPLVDKSFCLPKAHVTKIEGVVQNGILTVSITPEKPIQVQIV